MYLLQQDEEYLKETFPAAASFLVAAGLRAELETLLSRQAHKIPLIPYQLRRIAELTKAPACQEPWFVKHLEDKIEAIVQGL